jgi:hypothetical protein
MFIQIQTTGNFDNVRRIYVEARKKDEGSKVSPLLFVMNTEMILRGGVSSSSLISNIHSCQSSLALSSVLLREIMG